MTASASRDRALQLAKAHAVLGWGAVALIALSWGVGRIMPSPAPATAPAPAPVVSEGLAND